MSDILTSLPCVKRYPGNPVLTSADVPYRSDLVFNAGVIPYGDGYAMIFRNDYGATKEEWEAGKRFDGTNIGLALAFALERTDADGKLRSLDTPSLPGPFCLDRRKVQKTLPDGIQLEPELLRLREAVRRTDVIEVLLDCIPNIVLVLQLVGTGHLRLCIVLENRMDDRSEVIGAEFVLFLEAVHAETVFEKIGERTLEPGVDRRRGQVAAGSFIVIMRQFYRVGQIRAPIVRDDAGRTPPACGNVAEKNLCANCETVVGNQEEKPAGLVDVAFVVGVGEIGADIPILSGG